MSPPRSGRMQSGTVQLILTERGGGNRGHWNPATPPTTPAEFRQTMMKRRRRSNPGRQQTNTNRAEEEVKKKLQSGRTEKRLTEIGRRSGAHLLDVAPVSLALLRRRQPNCAVGAVLVEVGGEGGERRGWKKGRSPRLFYNGTGLPSIVGPATNAPGGIKLATESKV
jgi:hypothetical protein